MSATAAAQGTSAPTGQAGTAAGDGKSTQPAAGATQVNTQATKVDEAAKPSASILGDANAPEKGSETKPATDEPAKAQQAAEVVIKLPDGLRVDEAALKEFQGIAQKVGLDSEKATEIAAWHLKRQQAAEDAQLAEFDKQGEIWANELETWAKGSDAKADKVFAGKTIEQIAAAAKAAINAFGGPALAKAYADLGVGNHPEMVRAWARVGFARGEDNSDAGAGSAGNQQPASREEKLRRFYDKSQPAAG